jgi:hypothetical protein
VKVVLGDLNESHNGMHWGKATHWLETEASLKDAIHEFEPSTG